MGIDMASDSSLAAAKHVCLNHGEDTGAHDPEMSCTGLPSRTNRSFSMVKVLLPAAADPRKEKIAHSPAARATDALRI